MANRPKKPKSATPQPPSRVPQSSVPGHLQQTPAWSLASADQDGRWSLYGLTAATLADLLRRLGEMEAASWQDHRLRGSHQIAVGDLVAEARQRLETLGQDDIDELFSLRLNGKPRLWGILDGRVLKILWYDPDHEVCPSHLRHT
ncbi:MAG: hypothetical protein IT204_04685 [Fimbriimonadaceae bacterium]|nr:hypothetical protein [Fimbriimonadaceae bacterium]